MTEWWVIDTRNNQIVDCITTMRSGPPSLSWMCGAEHLRVTKTPTTEQLLSYKYYAERP